MDTVSESLNLEISAITDAALVNNGVAFIVLELDSLKSLQQLEPDFPKIHALSETKDLVGYYLFATEAGEFHTRMFAPAYGINEEPATGMGAGCLAAFLHNRSGKTEFQFKQGH